MHLGGKTVVVTGATGFLGRNLTAALLARGASVLATSRRPQHSNHERLRWVQLDLRDPGQLKADLEHAGADMLFHLSSMTDGQRDLALVQPTFDAEVRSTVNVLIAATQASIGRIVLAGSLEEPGGDAAASSPYAAAKATSRIYSRMFHLLYGTPVVMPRIFMCYGPGQAKWRVIPATIARLLRGERPQIGSPDRPVDWIHISDAIEGLLAVATTPGLDGTSVDIGSGSLITIGEVADLLRRIINPAIQPEFGSRSPRAHEQVRQADVAETGRLTGWSARVALEDGLRMMVEDIRAQAACGLDDPPEDEDK